MKIKDVMNKAIVVDHDMTIKEAAKIMSDKNSGSLVVVREDDILGIITESDIVKNLPNLGSRILSIMSKKVITVNQNEEIENAALLMTKNRVRRLPVVDSRGKLAGIVTSTDLIAHSDDIEEEFFFD